MSYTGFRLELDRDEITSKGIAHTSDTEDIEQSLSMIINTRKGERAGFPDYGCSAIDRIFDLNTEDMVAIVKDDIIEAIKKWEKRVRINNVTLSISPDEYKLDVKLDYDIIPRRGKMIDTII